MRPSDGGNQSHRGPRYLDDARRDCNQRDTVLPWSSDPAYRTRPYITVPTEDDGGPSASEPSSERPRSGPPSPANSSVKRRERAQDGQKDTIGLTVLHEPHGTPTADLVFVHGLGGGSITTWTASDQMGNFWPLKWLPYETSIESTRIHAYGYSSHFLATNPDRLLDMSDYAEDLLAKLQFGTDREGRSLNIGCAPLVFVAHSLGGLITKKAYLLATADPNSLYGQIAQATAAFVFFSTPHRDLDGSNVINDILSACVPGWQTKTYGDLVRRHLSKLQKINEKFRDAAPYFDLYSFYERPPTQASVAAGSLILPRDLAIIDHPSETAIPLDADHTTLTQYESQRDPNYVSVRGALRYLVEKLKPRRKSDFFEDIAGQSEKVDQLLQSGDAPEDDLSYFLDKRVEGSCEWVLEQPTMDSFLTGNGPYPQVLWCYGAPGSGKSVTATFLIDRLMDELKPCAYYYFRLGHQVRNSLGRFLTSVASQLSKQIPSYRQKLSALAGGRFDVENSGHKLLWKKLFVSALLQCDPRDPFYIVIDGLDELAHSKELLEKMFTEFGDTSMRLRLLLVSRPTPDIEASVERLSRRMQVRRLALDRNAEDLEAYVSWEMDAMPGDDHFKERTLNAVIAKASGNFLWAHLVVREVLACQTELQVEAALGQVPKQLEPLYERMDLRIAETFRLRPHDKHMGHKILMWAVCARRPLHLNELQGALEHDFPRIMDMRQTVQKLCGDFAIVDKQDFVSIMHASASQFLMSNPKLNYYVSAPVANRVLFSTCVQALTIGRRDHEALADPGRAFLGYAASSWPDHLTESSDYQDQGTFTGVMELFGSRVVLDWMFMLARDGNLRAMVEASRALSTFLKIVDKADRDRSPLLHRLEDKESLHLWAHDLIRVVGKFGPQLSRYPSTVYNLLPAFCPKESILHQQFNTEPLTSFSQGGPTLVVRGRMSPKWDDCFAKFAIPGDSSPHSIMSLGRYFAVLTKSDGIVHLYDSATCEVARRIRHGELVSVSCVDPSIARLATNSFQKTMIWEIESGQLLFSIESPRHTKVLAMAFQRSNRGDDLLLTLSDDGIVRSCSLETMHGEWVSHETSLNSDVADIHQVNAPHNAQFSPDGLYLAISYRGADPTIWSVGARQQRLVGHCDHRSRSSGELQQYLYSSYAWVLAFAWNPVTGHLLGTYEDGVVFKWNPRDDSFVLSELKSKSIKCSADGKLFVTGYGDGTLRIWDFEQFTPIYQLRYPLAIQDLDLGRTEARVYDIRDQYCNIWEPSSLLRAMESDDSASSKGSEQSALASEVVQEEFEPITAFATRYPPLLYATGDDSGRMIISDFDGRVLANIEGGLMSIEQLAWHENSNCLASVDLGRDIKIRIFDPTTRDELPWEEDKILRSFSETDEVLQLLFDASGKTLMVITPNAVKMHSTSVPKPPVVMPTSQTSVWVTHPQSERLALGFSATRATVTPWTEPARSVSLTYEPLATTKAIRDPASAMLPDLRQPSQTYSVSPADTDLSVTKVLVSPDAKLVMVDIHIINRQTRRRKECLLLETEHLDPNGATSSVPVSSVPAALVGALYMPLGFIEADSVVNTGRRRSLAEHSRSENRRRRNLSTLAFVDREFCVCSVDIGFGLEQQVDIHKHFFLPRDWQNSEWLEMATVTPMGHFLCPRNGDVAVVSNGFMEDLATHG